MEEEKTPITTTPPQPTSQLPIKDGKRNITLQKAMYIAVALLVLLLVVTLVVHVTTKSKTTKTAETSATSKVASVDLSDTGFTPSTLSVDKGTTVDWTVSSSDTKTHEIASNPYPSDSSLPSLKSKQIGNGVSYSYTFNTTGTYNYHDDLNPTLSGTVIVR